MTPFIESLYAAGHELTQLVDEEILRLQEMRVRLAAVADQLGMEVEAERRRERENCPASYAEQMRAINDMLRALRTPAEEPRTEVSSRHAG